MMPPPPRKRTETERKLDELLSDPAYAQTVKALTWEVARRWRLDHMDARRVVLSAIGEPTALVTIHEASRCGERRLAALISRRRVIDLLRKDAARAGHRSLSLSHDEIESDGALGALIVTPHHDVEEELQRGQLHQLVRQVLTSFGEQGPTQERQANLLRRRLLQGTAYSALSLELGCTQYALRVRVWAAKRSFCKYVRRYYPELIALWSHGSDQSFAEPIRGV